MKDVKMDLKSGKEKARKYYDQEAKDYNINYKHSRREL